MYGLSRVSQRASTVKAAQALLNRFFRDAEGSAERPLDIMFLCADAGVSQERISAGLDFLITRGLLVLRSSEEGHITPSGIAAVLEDWSLSDLPPDRPAFAEAGAFDSSEITDTNPPESSPSDGEARLTLVRADGDSQVFMLSAGCTIGRSEENTIHLDDKRASKVHARVVEDRHGFVLEDLGSANGTLINGGYCVGPSRLQNDDEIVIGRSLIIFNGPSSDAAPEITSGPAVQPLEGAPTDRPTAVGRRPSTSTPSIRVVRGDPVAAASEPSPVPIRPLELDEPPTDDDALPSSGPKPIDLGSLPPLKGPTTDLPPFLSSGTSGLPPFQPPSEAIAPIDLKERSDVLELSEIVPEGIASANDTVEEPPAEDEAPLRLDQLPTPSEVPEAPLRLDELPIAAESLPVAPVELLDARATSPSMPPAAEAEPLVPADARATHPSLPMAKPQRAEVLESLLRLEQEVAARAGPHHPVLEALRQVQQDPLVQTIADEGFQHTA